MLTGLDSDNQILVAFRITKQVNFYYQKCPTQTTQQVGMEA
jgi:hypothetical protein